MKRTDEKSVEAEEVARELLKYLEDHPDQATAIARESDPERLLSLIDELPGPCRRLIEAFIEAGRPTLEESGSGMEALGHAKEWVLSFRAPLRAVGELMREQSEESGTSGLIENPIMSIGSYCSYYPSRKLGMIHLTFYDPDEDVLFRNTEPIDETMKTARNILEHVASGYDELTDAGCSLEQHDPDVDVETLARIERAVRQICTSRGMSLKKVLELAIDMEKSDSE